MADESGGFRQVNFRLTVAEAELLDRVRRAMAERHEVRVTLTDVFRVGTAALAARYLDAPGGPAVPMPEVIAERERTRLTPPRPPKGSRPRPPGPRKRGPNKPLPDA